MSDRAPQSAESRDDGMVASTLVDFLEILTKHRKFISRFVLSVTVSTTLIAFLLPKWYSSTASVFPAEKAELFGALEGISSLARNFSPTRALSALGSNPEADRYMAILKSGTVIGAVIEKFRLDSVYDITSYKAEKTAKALLNNSEFTVEPEGNITITIYDRDPNRAADMANFFVEMLNKTNTELQVMNARGNRQFIEERYNKNLLDLAAAEDSLKGFQKKYGIVAMPEQTEASIKAMAEIAGQLALKEVQAGVLRRTQSPDNPSVVAAQIEIDEIRRQLSDINSGRSGLAGGMNVFVPFSKVPELGGEYVRRFREVEIQYKILQFITPLYEQAKVEEKRQTPSVLVLDKAAPAERKSKPKVTLYSLIALVASILVSFLLVLLFEMQEKLKQTYPSRVNALVSTLRKDWFGIRGWRR